MGERMKWNRIEMDACKQALQVASTRMKEWTHRSGTTVTQRALLFQDVQKTEALLAKLQSPVISHVLTGAELNTLLRALEISAIRYEWIAEEELKKENKEGAEAMMYEKKKAEKIAESIRRG
jgi:hypothetical protein